MGANVIAPPMETGEKIFDRVTGEPAEVVTIEKRRIVIFLINSRLHARRWRYQLTRTQPETRADVLAAIRKIKPHNIDGADCLAKLPTRQALKIAVAAYSVNLSIRTVAAELGLYFNKEGGIEEKPRQ